MKLVNSGFLLLIGTAFLLAGCVVGGGLSTSYIAQNPKGEDVEVNLKDRQLFTLTGEMLAFQDQQFFVLMDQRIFKASIQNIESVRFLNEGMVFRVRNGAAISYRNRNPEEVNELIITHARYPQGISDTLMVSLLEAYNQDEILIVE